MNYEVLSNQEGIEQKCRNQAKEICQDIENGVIRTIQERHPDENLGTPVRVYGTRAHVTDTGATIIELKAVDAKGNRYTQLFAGAEDLLALIALCKSVLTDVEKKEQKVCKKSTVN